MTSAEGKGTAEPRALRQPRPLVVPDNLPGENEYGLFVNHMVRCPDCGYGQVQCEKATKLWQAYKAERAAKKRT